MKKIGFIVERTSTGYSAYAENFDKCSVATTGSGIVDLKKNIVEATNLFLEHTNQKPVTENDIAIRYDLPQFFEFYKEINAAALSKRIGLNQTLLSQYVNGKKRPSEKQVQKILMGIRELGRELVEIDLI